MRAYVEVPISRGLTALVDDADADLVLPYRWFALPAPRSTYAARHVRRPDGGRTVMAMHRVLTGYAITDHVNGNGLDNRRANLREATVSQNGANRRKAAGGTSRFKGVGWRAARACWQAVIQVRGRRVYIGNFADEEAAARAYDAAAREHFGEYARLNFPDNP